MRRLGTIVCRFFFLDGRTKAIDIHPTDTASDAVYKLADKLCLRSIDGWSIYQSRSDGEEHVRAHHYLYDIIAAWQSYVLYTHLNDVNPKIPNLYYNLKSSRFCNDSVNSYSGFIKNVNV